MWQERFAELLSNRAEGRDPWSEANALKRQNMPPRLYKYQAWNQRNLESLRAGQVWLAAPDAFNDPFELAVCFDHDEVFTTIRERADEPASRRKSLLVRMIQGETCGLPEGVADELVSNIAGLYAAFTRPVIDRATSKLRAQFLICCFSETVTSVPMWAHYAGCHTGFCVQWELLSCSEAPDFQDSLYPVFYDTKPFQMPSLAVNPPFEGAEILLALRKAQDWSYEREWRYVERASPGSTGKLKQVPRPAAVYAGARIEPDAARSLTLICEELGIPLLRMRCDLQRGELLTEDANPA